VSESRTWAPYMGALAAASWAWSARGYTRYGGKWAWLAGCGPCTTSRPEWQAGRSGSMRVDCREV